MPSLAWSPRRLLLPPCAHLPRPSAAPIKPVAAAAASHQQHPISRRSRRRAQLQPSVAATSSSTPLQEASSLQQQDASAEGECMLLGSPSVEHGSSTQQQQQQQQQQWHELHHHELQGNECNGMCQGEEQSTMSSSLQQELPVNTKRTIPSSMHSQANGRGATPEGARLQGMSNLMSARVPRSRLHRPAHRPDPLPPDSSMQHQTVPRAEPRWQQHQHLKQQHHPPFILFPPPDLSNGSKGSSAPDPSPDGSHFPLQPPLQAHIGSTPAPLKKPSPVLGARWGKWVLHMRPWYALLRPWWCRKAKRRRRPKPNRFRMTVSRTSDLDILQELQQFRQQQQHETQPHSAQALSDSSRHTSSSSSASSRSSELGRLVTTLVMQPRQTISKPAKSTVHTLGGLSNCHKPWAHYTLDGGAHWRSMPFSNIRSAQGGLLLAAELDCSSTTRSNSSNNSNSSSYRATSRKRATSSSSDSAPQSPPGVLNCTRAKDSASTEGAPASASLQVIVTTSPHPPAQSTGEQGSPSKWRHHLLQLQPGACYMLEDAAAARKRVQSPKGASYPLSIAHDPLMHQPLVNGSNAAAPSAPPPYPFLPPSSSNPLPPATSPSIAQRSQGSSRSLEATLQQQQQHQLQQQNQPQELHLQQQQLKQQQLKQQLQAPLFHRLLKQSVVLVASVHMVAGQQRCPEDDAGARTFQTCWRHSNLVHPSLLVYTTHRCWRSYQQLWKDKQHVLEAPDVLILANGTRIMYQVAGGGWQEDMQWRAVLDDGWDRKRVVQVAEAVATAMNDSTQSHLQQPRDPPHHVDIRNGWDQGPGVQEAEAVATAMKSNTQQQQFPHHLPVATAMNSNAQQQQFFHPLPVETAMNSNTQPHWAQQLQHRTPQFLQSHVDTPILHQQNNQGSDILEHPGTLQGVEPQSRSAAPGEQQQQQQQQHQQEVATGVGQPQTLVRADVVKEQNSHRVRMLVRVHALGTLLAALQRELEAARVRQQEDQLAQRMEHLPLFSVLRPEAQYFHSTSAAAHAAVQSSPCSSSRGVPWSDLSSPLHSRTHQDQHHPYQQHLQQKSLPRSQLSPQPCTTNSISSSEGIGRVGSRPFEQQHHNEHAAKRQGSVHHLEQQQQQQKRPMSWSLVLQPPHVIGQGRNWAAVDVIPHSAGVGPALAYVLARFGINAQPQLQQQQRGPGSVPELSGTSTVQDQGSTASGAQRPQAGSVPVVACTNSLQEQESLRQVSTLSITHVPQALRGRRFHGGLRADEEHGDHQTDVVSHSWGAVGVLEGLAKLGLS